MTGVKRISLAEAMKSDRLEDFILQEESRGVGSVDRADLDEALRRVIRPHQSERRTSRSASAGGLTGK